MQFSWRNIAAVVVFWLLVFSTAWAGVDDIRVVTKLTGGVQVRGSIRREQRAFRFARWQPLEMGDIIYPDSQICTGARSRVWLQQGDQVEYPARMPDDVLIIYDELHPRTQVRLNDQHKTYKSGGKIPIFQVITGKMILHKVRGRVPRVQYYKSHR